MKYLLMIPIALALMGCNNDTTNVIEDADSNDTIQVRQTFIALCDEVTTISIMANDGNVTIDDNNSYSGSNLNVSINVVVDCIEDENITEVDDNATD